MFLFFEAVPTLSVPGLLKSGDESVPSAWLRICADPLSCFSIIVIMGVVIFCGSKLLCLGKACSLSQYIVPYMES